jgi:hypothetical protein
MKNKKIFIIAAITVFLFGIVIFTLFKSVSFSYKSCVVSDADMNRMIQGKEKAELVSCDLYFNGEKLFYDSQNNVYYYSLIEGSSKAFNPTVMILSELSDEKILFDGEITEQGIEADESIRFTVYDNEHYFESELKCTTLPIISIETIEELSNSPDVSVDMNIEVFDNRSGVTKRLLSSFGKTHVRGATTLANPKKSLRISLTSETENGDTKKNKLSLLGMRKDDDWVLNALCVDPEKVRDVFSTNLWENTVATDNSYGLNLGVEYKYVEVLLNGEYHGLYALGYPVQSGELGISEDDQNTVMFRKREAYLGGTTLLESDGALAAFRLESKHDRSYHYWMTDYLIDVDMAANNPEKLRSLVDMDNAIDFYLYLAMIQGWDNIYKNQDVLLERNDDSYKMVYIPWDMDLTWGLEPGYTLYESSVDTVYPYQYEVLYMLLQNDTQNTKALIQEKYNSLRKDKWSDEKLGKLIDYYEEQIFDSGAYLREISKWPDNVKIEPQQKLGTFKSYVLSRMQAMDEYVQNLETDPEYNYPGIRFGSDVVADCVSQLFEEEDELVLLQINNLKLWEDDYYTDIMLSFGIPDEYIDKELTLRKRLNDKYEEACKDTGTERKELSLENDVDLVISYKQAELSTCSNFFGDQNFADTPIGELDYYISDDGVFGLYLDNYEILSGNVNEEDFDFRVIHIDAESYEVNDIEEYNLK